MAELWQRALALLHVVCLLCRTSGALRRDDSGGTALLEFQVVKGNFSRTFLRVGYHKIAEIPVGARNINVQETVKSRNYLALQTQTGDTVINGNWVIDRPGVFAAAGTQVTYRRPNEIRSRGGESITAAGPLAEELHVYLIYQQPGPSVHYEYSVPLHNIQPTAEPDSHKPTERPEPSEPGEGGGAEEGTPEPTAGRVPPEPSVTPHPQTYTYTWAKSGHAECSATCGSGRRQVLWECVEEDSRATVAADRCDPGLRTTQQQQEDCNAQPCPAYWDVGEWSECSQRCGPGTQHRQVICRQVTRVHGNGTESPVTVAPELCGLSDEPATKTTCQLKICSRWEIQSEWSLCSVPCGVGQRHRQVVCLSNHGDVEDDDQCNMNLKPDALQNCDMGTCARSWFTSLWSHRCSAECGKGNKTRTAVCLMDHATDLPLDSCDGDRPAEVTSCDSGPCKNQLEWYTGPWGQCSAECGNGTQSRSAVCIINSDGNMAVVDRSQCSRLPRPITAQTCSVKPCGVQWYVTEWSACSRSCNGGYRVREARCLADNIAPSDRCDANFTPESREECNKQPCLAEINPSCSDQYNNCLVVVQARLCIYPYYRSVCCASCSNAQKTYPSSKVQKNNIRR